MGDLWFYRWLSRFRFLNYRGKIAAMAFIGTHIPLIALASYFAFQTSPDWHTFFMTVGITLVATLVGTALTLFVLNELLRPVVKTSEALRAYRSDREVRSLPTEFTDEVGTLMADAGSTIAHLEATRDLLEHSDAATGLMNRKGFLRDLAARQSGAEPFPVAVFRIANLARVVEAFDGREADAAMKAVAGRLAAAGPAGMLLARVGQSELAAALAPGAAGNAGDAVDAMAAAAAAPLAIGGIGFHPEVVSGIAIYPADAAEAEALLDHAVAAAAAATPEMPTVHHSPEARARAADRLRLEQQLRQALERDEFMLHYQPVVDLARGTVAGAEALIRWQSPARGLVMPGQFIPVAERCGLIDPIGLWVMRRACEQAREWNALGRTDLAVAVNLSARQFLDPDLRHHVAEAIAATRIGPDQLEIELTETAAMADQDHTRRTFSMLRDLGVRIAIDDFGTGYASMSWLRSLPFDKLKIDREFVSGVAAKPDAQAICRALITLSHGLGLKVLAEGAEEEAEVAFLAGSGCDLFQGFYFSKPVPAAEFAATADSIALRSLIRKARPATASAVGRAAAG